MDLHTLKVMNGTFYGVQAVAKAIYMKGLMSFRKLTTFHKATKLPEKIDYVIIWSECKKDLANKTSILFLILIFFQMNSVIFMPIIKNSNNMIVRKIYGL